MTDKQRKTKLRKVRDILNDGINRTLRANHCFVHRYETIYTAIGVEIRVQFSAESPRQRHARKLATKQKGDD